MTDPTAAAQAALDAVGDDELGEAADLCAQLGIPAQYARNVAAAIAACRAGEATPPTYEPVAMVLGGMLLGSVAPIGRPQCGTTIGAGETPRFVCTLEPHDGHVHANPAAIAWLLANGNGWVIENGRIPDPHAGVLRFRDCMGEARRLNTAAALPPERTTR